MAKLSANPSLFWRTFILIMLLIVFSVTGWLQSFRVLNETPYALGTAQQIVSMANLTRYAVVTADPVYRPDLLMVLAKREGLRILPKEDDDIVIPLSQGFSYARTSIADVEELVTRELGPGTVMASSVNGKRGLWVSISIEGDNYWLMTRSSLIDPPIGTTWAWWALAALVASILATMLLARRLVKPLNELSENAKQFGRGLVPRDLPEDSGPEELREVNSSFNRMVQDITRMEQDREVLLAGVSHDLRTPITRLRLETEMAALPDDTHDAMVSDLEQMEMIVNQFAAYAKRNTQPLERVSLSDTVTQYIKTARVDIDPGVKIETLSVEPDVFVSAHPLELSRVVQNIISNAQRYGRSEDDLLHLSVTVRRDKSTAFLIIADQGAGLDMSEAERVMRPFERGESARTGVSGSGLGLAIVDRIAKRSSGTVELSVSRPHGLSVTVKIPVYNEKSEKTKRYEEKLDKAQDFGSDVVG